jgi:hypothetical protein
MKSSVLTLSLFCVACSSTTALYQGPPKSPNEVAVISNGRGANIRAIDGTIVNAGDLGHYELLPGTHRLEFEGHQATSNAFVTTHYETGMIGRCLVMAPGHRYTVDATLIRDRLLIEFFDYNLGTPVSADGCGDLWGSKAKPNPIAAILPKLPRPEWVMFFGFGWDFGGDDVVNVSFSNGTDQTLSAGGGAVLPIGGTWTPLWLGDVLGLGAGGRIALKFDEVAANNGHIYLTRFPLSLWLQSYLALNEAWYLAIAGGAHKDLGPSLSGSGAGSRVNASFNSPWGWFGELGVIWFQTWHFGMGGSIRYTSMRYTYGRTGLDASNLGLMFTFYMNR